MGLQLSLDVGDGSVQATEGDDFHGGNGRSIHPILDPSEGFVGHKVIDSYQSPGRLLRSRSRCPWGRFSPLLYAAVAPVHSLSRPVNRCHLLSQIIHSDGGHKRPWGGLVSSPCFERRILVISVLLLPGIGGLTEQKNVKLKNVSSWDFTGGLPTLGRHRSA